MLNNDNLNIISLFEDKKYIFLDSNIEENHNNPFSDSFSINLFDNPIWDNSLLSIEEKEIYKIKNKEKNNINIEEIKSNDFKIFYKEKENENEDKIKNNFCKSSKENLSIFSLSEKPQNQQTQTLTKSTMLNDNNFNNNFSSFEINRNTNNIYTYTNKNSFKNFLLEKTNFEIEENEKKQEYKNGQKIEKKFFFNEKLFVEKNLKISYDDKINNTKNNKISKNSIKFYKKKSNI